MLKIGFATTLSKLDVPLVWKHILYVLQRTIYSDTICQENVVDVRILKIISRNLTAFVNIEILIKSV